MAQKVSIELVDDLDGKPADETVKFGLDGKNYEIDLTSKNADKLRGILLDYVNKGRKASGSSRNSNKAPQSGPSAAEVREWAKSNGIEVPDRGRIPQEVRDAFNAA